MIHVVKYEIPTGSKSVLEIVPPGRILMVGVELGILYIYALSDDVQRAYPKKVQVVKVQTGKAIESVDAVGFIGSVNPPIGPVIHVFTREL